MDSSESSPQGNISFCLVVQLYNAEASQFVHSDLKDMRNGLATDNTSLNRRHNMLKYATVSLNPILPLRASNMSMIDEPVSPTKMETLRAE